MKIDRVAYIGNFRAPHCTEVHLAQTMEQYLGLVVDRIQEDEVPLPEIEQRAKACDLLLYTRTWGIGTAQNGRGNGAEAIDAWRRIEASGVPTASYHLDLYYGLERGSKVPTDPFWRTQYVFTPDGDPEAQVWFEDAGINHHWVRPGVFEWECREGRVDAERFPFPVVFVGSWKNYHKEWPHRKRLVQHLMRGKFEKRVGIYGHESLGTVRGLPLNDLYATANIVIGDSLCPNYTKSNYWSDRVYETVGRGGYLAHPHVRGLEQEFIADTHLSFYDYGQFDEVDTLIEKALDEPEWGREVARQGQSFVKNNCTYTQRLKNALSVIENG